MRTIRLRALAIGALGILAVATAAPAQTRSPGLLSSVEVRQLVQRAEPGDHARLSVHFAALDEQYTAEASRHRSMSQGFAGNPSRGLGTGMTAHCNHLADLNTQSATTLRELAVYHNRLAAGTTSATPADRARFQEGAGAPNPTDQELRALAETARTPSDHRTLEEYFLTLATRHAAAAKDHAAMAQTYRGTRLAGAGVHCDRLVALSRDSAREATEAAAMHKHLADTGR
jgi:hypothetical protein